MRTLFIAPLLLIAGPAHAETAPAPGSIIELSWNEAPPDRTRVSLALPAERGCASLDLELDRRELKVSACRIGGDAESPMLELAVDRTDRSGSRAPTSQCKLKATVRLRRGQPATIGRFERDQHPTELVATLRQTETQ